MVVFFPLTRRIHVVTLLNYGTIVDSETKEKSYAFDALMELGYKIKLKNILINLKKNILKRNKIVFTLYSTIN